MNLFLRASLVLAACLGLQAQPSLQTLWARHDQLVLSVAPRPGQVDPACASTFTGRRGQPVRGWDVGPPEAPVVLFWAGGPGSPAEPGRDAQLFKDPGAFRHLEIDLPGTGASAWVPGWRPEDAVEDAVTFLRQRGITGPVVVAGYSWGSTMALLFAQRHPEWAKGVAVGGVWANTPREVHRYLDEGGARAWTPEVAAPFRLVTRGGPAARAIHAAIAKGEGGPAFAQAYARAEGLQAGEGTPPRAAAALPIPRTPGHPVDMTAETSEAVRFAYIESEMMARGERGAWRLRLRFPGALRRVPLVVVQGRFDQVCDPEVARRVYRAWPGRRKLLAPFSGGHGSFRGPSASELAQAGLTLTADQEGQLKKAMRLHFGSAGLLWSGAIACLLEAPAD